MSVQAAAVLLLVVAVFTGCGRPDPAVAPAPPAALELPACGKPPSPDPQPPPPGAVLPPESRITALREQPPRVQLNGYVMSTPRAVRAWVESQEALHVVAARDDGYEVEMLVTDGDWRTFIRARAICTDASLLSEVIAPASSDAVLPTPAP